ncbi:endospore germination permease [Aquibacillus koreensis]|uniref:Endospore germination permease n=1 Tax=Aquibacillus koreensis TaxID=279446 RepID=A0A9X3WPY6_9BACI|nr:endospore germination permease [Aquibacillus koreensis]MCT2536969.1 endospore germination permease [Aquibacillus koreensis]MDC3422728.1 endospore germination permease [Aquibacillus koreensis]
MKDYKTLTTREMFALVTLLVGIKFADTTPALLAQKGQNAFWMIPIISFLIIFPSFLLLIYLLKRYKDKNLVELLEKVLGRFFGKSLGFLLFILAYATLIFDSRNYVEQIKLLYYPQSPTLIISIVFMAVIFFCAKRGFEVIGFTSWIGLPLIKFAVFLLAALIFKEAVWNRIFPIFGSGVQVIVMEGVKNSSIFLEFFLLTIAYTAFKDTKFFRRGSYFGGLFVIFEIILFFLLYTVIFDYNSIDKIAFPFHEITQYINFGDYFTNIETFFMVFWLFAGFMRFIILLYLITWIFGAVFNINEFEPLLFPFAFLALMIGVIPENAIVNELIIRDLLLDISTPLFVLFPFILWIVALCKGELKKT